MKTAQVGFEQEVSRICGIDVHKKMVVATINGKGLQQESRAYSTFTSSLTQMKEWLLEKGITHIAMGITGVYWQLAYQVLEPSGIKVWIVNARHLKYVPGHNK